MKYIYLALLSILSIKSFGQNDAQRISVTKPKDMIVNEFVFYPFKNEFPILEGKSSIYNLILTGALGEGPGLLFDYSLKKALIDYKYIDDKPKARITSKLFNDVLRNASDVLRELFKNQTDDFKNLIYDIDTKSLKKHLISYDNNEYYIGEAIDENGKLVKKGYGAYFFKNGDRYEGFWVNDKKNGQGCMFYKTTSLNNVKKEILYHQNDTIVFKSITFLTNGDFIHRKGNGKFDQTYFYLNRTNPKYFGRYRDELVNNLPNGYGEKKNYINDRLVNEIRGFFVDGKISVEDKKKPEYIGLVSLSNKESKNLSIGVQQSSKQIQYEKEEVVAIAKKIQEEKKAKVLASQVFRLGEVAVCDNFSSYIDRTVQIRGFYAASQTQNQGWSLRRRNSFNEEQLNSSMTFEFYSENENYYTRVIFVRSCPVILRIPKDLENVPNIMSDYTTITGVVIGRNKMRVTNISR